MRSRFPLADSAASVLAGFEALLRAEARLLQAELSEKLQSLRLGIALVLASAIATLVALGVLADALVALLVASGFEPAAAGGVVGGVSLVVALLLGWAGARRLRPSALRPDRSIAALQTEGDA